MAAERKGFQLLVNSVRCSATGVVPTLPVTAEDGYVYERTAIEAWLLEHSSSPTTSKPMGSIGLFRPIAKNPSRQSETSLR